MTNDGKMHHASEARATLEHEGYPESNEGVMLHALTHATLALVEQQRIANLIAWTTANGSEPSADVALEIVKGLRLW